MSDFTSPTQQKFVALIATGSSTAEAAAAAGVHRNTVLNWLRSPSFNAAYRQAANRRSAHFHQQAEALAIESFAAIRAIITDPHMPPAVRLKAALAMIDRADTALATPTPDSLPEPQAEPEPQHPESESPFEESLENLHNSAQPQPIHSVKIGRNELCPCGSGVKFKRCCLGKPIHQAVQAA